MARIHVLQAVGVNLYQVVVHDATPAGTNSANVSWATAIGNSGLAQTVMTEGNGAGQISTNEKNQVLGGSLIEGVFQFQDDPSMTPAQRNAALDAVANQTIAELQARYASLLKYFGATRN